MARTIYLYEHRSKKKIKKMIFEKVSKTMENVRNIDILNLSQQKNEGII